MKRAPKPALPAHPSIFIDGSDRYSAPGYEANDQAARDLVLAIAVDRIRRALAGFPAERWEFRESEIRERQGRHSGRAADQSNTRAAGTDTGHARDGFTKTGMTDETLSRLYEWIALIARIAFGLTITEQSL